MSDLQKIKYELKKISSTEDKGKYKVFIKIPLSLGWIDHVSFQVERKGSRDIFSLKHKKNDLEYAYFEEEIELPTRALYHYYFSFDANSKPMIYKKNIEKNTTHIDKEDMWKLSVNFEVPKWAQGKIMYHIFVDRFNRGDKNPPKKMKNRTILNWNEDIYIGPDKNGIWNADFYGGDLKGIIDKLDYISSLGVSILYLSPIVWSQSNHRYDTADYETVDPYVGTNKDLKELCDKAHQKGMKVILDAVFNHTGNDSKYFNEFNHYDELGAYQSRESKYFPFYRKYYQNNKVMFDYWWGMKNLPVCDGTSKEWQDYIYGEGGIIDCWFALGIDGLRLDVADELSDEFIEGIRKAVKRNKKDGFILGEVWKNPMHMKRGYIESGKGMESVMDYPLVDALIRYYKYKDKEKLKEVLRSLKIDYPDETLYSLMNFTSTHDITRAINIFSTKEFQYNGEWAWNLNNNDRNWQKDYRISEEDYKRGKEIYKSYLYALDFLPGNLSIFYGDEVGLQGMGNLANRRPFPWGLEDKDLLEYFRWLGKIRKENPYLENALFEVIDVNDSYFQFLRDNTLITVSRTSEKSPIIIPRTYEDSDILYLLGSSSKKELDSYGGVVLKKKK